MARPPCKEYILQNAIALNFFAKEFSLPEMRQKISIHINAVSKRHFVIGLFPRASYFMLNMELEKQSLIYGFIYCRGLSKDS